ncbi:hypothetical protein HXX76_009201 [Chlamydomonas incerta]|uniref:Uncharacterized protein n=1 Tax=Chlamydomonas incerta TaxID=51695 RepID=A0A835STS2_CHLIN|nr:hypothetical protein HXX76_009201 [Chlamydomonas incerta]|eukprot:KAG2431701.1 hypothetical protein HXX76_009201 [Chlamydomonas incerta]
MENWYPAAEAGKDKGLLLVVIASKEGAVTGGARFTAAVGDNLMDSIFYTNIPIFTDGGVGCGATGGQAVAVTPCPVVGMWWSAKPASWPRAITTQLSSWNRKWQLKAMPADVLLPAFVTRGGSISAGLRGPTRW